MSEQAPEGDLPEWIIAKRADPEVTFATTHHGSWLDRSKYYPSGPDEYVEYIRADIAQQRIEELDAQLAATPRGFRAWKCPKCGAYAAPDCICPKCRYDPSLQYGADFAKRSRGEQ